MVNKSAMSSTTLTIDALTTWVESGIGCIEIIQDPRSLVDPKWIAKQLDLTKFYHLLDVPKKNLYETENILNSVLKFRVGNIGYVTSRSGVIGFDQSS